MAAQSECRETTHNICARILRLGRKYASETRVGNRVRHESLSRLWGCSCCSAHIVARGTLGVEEILADGSSNPSAASSLQRILLDLIILLLRALVSRLRASPDCWGASFAITFCPFIDVNRWHTDGFAGCVRRELFARQHGSYTCD